MNLYTQVVASVALSDTRQRASRAELLFAIAQDVNDGVEVLSRSEPGLPLILLTGIRTQPSLRWMIHVTGYSAQSVAVHLVSTIREAKYGSILAHWMILSS